MCVHTLAYQQYLVEGTLYQLWYIVIVQVEIEFLVSRWWVVLAAGELRTYGNARHIKSRL